MNYLWGTQTDNEEGQTKMAEIAEDSSRRGESVHQVEEGLTDMD